MKTLQQNETRVEHYLKPRMGRLREMIRERLVDPRMARGKTISFDSMLLAMIAGIVGGRKTLRDVEHLSQRLGLGRRGGRISDNAMTYLLCKLDDVALRPLLVGQVKDMGRRGQLKPDVFAMDWTTIDGKYEALDHHADGAAQKMEQDKHAYWRLGVLRAVLVSAASRPVLGQLAIPAGTGEQTNVLAFITLLREWYGELTSNFTLDAGLWSRELFAKMDEQGLGIFGNIKENKPELHAEVARVLRLARIQACEAETEWEPCKRGQIKRRLWRTFSLDGWNGWKHLRQAIVVEQTTRLRDGSEEVELRYFATNLPKNKLSAKQLLLLVRRHWAIENDCNWTFDMVMAEDAGAWCTQRKSVLALGVIRMVACNLMQALRKCHVRVQHVRVPDTPMPWRELQELAHDVWKRVGRALLGPPGRVTSLCFQNATNRAEG